MIDDIDYLLENSEKDSVIIFADSGLRDKRIHPFASEYTISFAQPFKFVYGFEVIDGTIPNTMYNVDLYNNAMYITSIVKNVVSMSLIDPRVQLMQVHTSKKFAEMFNKSDQNYIIIGTQTNLAPLVNMAIVSALSENHLVFYKHTITSPPIILFKNQPDTYFFFTFGNVKYAILKANNSALITIIENEDYYYDVTANILYHYTVNKVDPTTFNTIKNSSGYIVVVNNYRKTLSPGNYDITSITADTGDMLTEINVEVEPTSAPAKKEGKMLFASSDYILLNAQKGRLFESFGFDIYPPAGQNGTNYESWTIGDNYQIYGSLFDSLSTRYQVISPGLINLLGERYCILRIKELEDHLFGSYSYMQYTTGIGMFKMAAAQGGITNLRFDYQSLVKKPFHPIGKVDRLSLRYETSSGNLYDFKGVNHHLMFIIKFLVPSVKLKFTKSILNPNYDPNIMQYMSNNKAIEYREDSDDEEEFDEEEYYKLYKKQLDDMDYSASESEDEDDESGYTSSSEEEV